MVNRGMKNEKKNPSTVQKNQKKKLEKTRFFTHNLSLRKLFFFVAIQKQIKLNIYLRITKSFLHCK